MIVILRQKAWTETASRKPFFFPHSGDPKVFHCCRAGWRPKPQRQTRTAFQIRCVLVWRKSEKRATVKELFDRMFDSSNLTSGQSHTKKALIRAKPHTVPTVQITSLCHTLSHRAKIKNLKKIKRKGKSIKAHVNVPFGRRAS